MERSQIIEYRDDIPFIRHTALQVDSSFKEMRGRLNVPLSPYR